MEVKGHVDIPALEPVSKPEVAAVDVPKRRGRPIKAKNEVVEDLSSVTVEWGDVRLPLAVVGDLGYCARHVQIQLSASEATKLKRFVLALQSTGATIGTRKDVIRSGSDALRYMLTQLPD